MLPSLRVIGLEPFEDFLRVVQDGGGRIERDRLAGAHLRIVPAAVLRPADGHHVIGEDTAEARILQQLGPRIGCDGLARRRCGKTRSSRTSDGRSSDLVLFSVPGPGVLPRRPSLGYCLACPAHLRLPDRGLDRHGGFRARSFRESVPLE